MYDAQIGRWDVLDKLSERKSSLSSYSYVANNPIKNMDINGDSIRVSENIKSDNRIWDALSVLGSTSSGRKKFSKFGYSKTDDVYIDKRSRPQAVAYSLHDLNEKEAYYRWKNRLWE